MVLMTSETENRKDPIDIESKASLVKGDDLDDDLGDDLDDDDDLDDLMTQSG